MHTPKPITQPQRSVLADLLRRRLATMEQQSGTKLEHLTQAQHAYKTLHQDLDDAPQRSGEEEVEAAVADIDNQEFSDATQALQRIHSADYGLCVDCHAPIAFERLQIEPQALRCTACQALVEQAR